MVAKFRALNKHDLKDIGTVISSNVGADSYELIDSNSYSNSFGNTGPEQSLENMHTRKVVLLTKPVFNHVLGTSNCMLLQKILGVPRDTWMRIIKFSLVYDPYEDMYVPIDDAYDGGKYLYGAEIAEHLIEELDINEAIKDCFYDCFSEFFKVGVDARSFITIDKNESGQHLGDKYYAHYEQKELLSSFKRGYSPISFEKDYKEVLFSNNNTRLTYLLNMNKDKSGLYGMLNYFIVVVPSEMRPRIDGRDHRLTKLYTKVIKANYELRVNMGASSPRAVCSAYNSLEISVKHLQYKRQDNSIDVKPDDLSLLERIKSKKGQIRMKNLGKRQDYSGRAVVCINPYLPLDVIRVPKSMLPKLLEFHILPYLAKNINRNNYNLKMNNHLSNIYDKLSLGNLDAPEARKEMLRIINDNHLLDGLVIVLGRQPTLHRQSLQGFHIEATDLQAFEINPLVCPAFNMDFDGDQAHGEIPITIMAVEECNKLILTTQNLFLSKTGECTTEPRQDMLYGLWMCTRDTYTVGKSIASYETAADVRQAVINHKVRVWDTVTVLDMSATMVAGDAAFIACFPKGDLVPRGASTHDGKMSVGQVDKKTITQYIDYLLRTDSFGNFVHKIGTGYASTDYVVGSINAMVELGFKVARLYPPNISTIIEDKSIPEYDGAIEKLHESMTDIDFMYYMGFETSDNYKLAFASNLDVMNNTMRDNLIDKLGEDNGFVKLSTSGARGSLDNLLQTFAVKGQVKKNETEAFDALLENSYASQMTPMEHSVAAYGGRQGMMDKSLKTGDTGYAMRKMWHATQSLHMIVTKDCGTSEGIPISKRNLVTFVDTDDKASIDSEVSKIFVHAIVGRYQPGSNKVITKAEAQKWADDPNIDTIVIRSPLTCKCPVCSKCYGIDWSTRKVAVVGAPVGVRAAQSIGEPGTQLTLKQFQKGGLAGKAEVTSAFDKVDSYIHVSNLAKLSKTGRYSGYDPVAWATGNLIEEPASDINKKIVRIEGYKGKRIVVPKSVVLKNYAVKGEGLSFRHGDYDINELLKYGEVLTESGEVKQPAIVTAQLYLMFKLYSLYKSEIQIKMIHFEMLVACMTRYMIVSTDRDDLMVGQYATSSELRSGSIANTEFIPRLIGVKKLPNASHDALDAIIMEAPVAGLSRACVLGMQDSLTKPLNRMTLALRPISGSTVPGYIESVTEDIM